MRSSLFRSLSLLLVLGLISCSTTPPLPDPGPDRFCNQDKTSVDFGTVIVGEYLVEPITIWFDDVDGMHPDGISTTISCADKDLIFSDMLGETTTDEMQLDIAPGEEETFYVMFKPQSAGAKTFTLTIWGDCSDIKLSGIGALPTGWSLDGQPTEYDLYDVWGSSTQTFVCGDHGVVANKVGDEGSWSLMAGTGISDIPIYSCWGFEGDIVWFVGGVSDFGVTYAKAHRYVLAAETWAEFLQSTFLDYYGSVWGASECDIYFGGAAIGGFMPNFAHWDCTDLDESIVGMGYDLVSGIFGSSADDIWAVRANAYDSLYHYEGSGWEATKEAFMTQALHDVWVSNGGETFAVGANGAIYCFDGADWEDNTIPSCTETFYGVWGTSDKNVYVVGTKGSIYHYDGNIWQAQSAPTGVSGTLFSVWGRSAGEVYVVGEGGVVLCYRDGD